MDQILNGRPTGSTGRGLSWRGTLNTIADIVLPPRCLACGASIDAHDGLCAACWAGIDFIEQPLCDRLGIPLPFAPDGDEKLVSAAALANPPHFERARAVARYSETMRVLIHDLKYRDRHVGLKLFARWLAHAGDELIADGDLLVPVPLHAGRLWSRRFNQSALLAGALGRATGLPSDPMILKRNRRTRSQVGLTGKQREANVTGAFAVRPGQQQSVKGRSIVLIDDVITTGATVNACAKALGRAGAVRVDVLALGRIVDPLAPHQ